MIIKSFFFLNLFNYDNTKNNNIIPENNINKKLNKSEQQRKLIEEKQAKQKINNIDIDIEKLFFSLLYYILMNKKNFIKIDIKVLKFLIKI